MCFSSSYDNVRICIEKNKIKTQPNISKKNDFSHLLMQKKHHQYQTSWGWTVKNKASCFGQMFLGSTWLNSLTELRLLMTQLVLQSDDWEQELCSLTNMSLSLFDSSMAQLSKTCQMVHLLIMIWYYTECVLKNKACISFWWLLYKL